MTDHQNPAATRCRHRLFLDKCPLCGPNRAAVWFTDGGTAFHTNRDCESLDSGQAKVAARGGLVSSKHRVGPLTDLSDEGLRLALRRNACEHCVWGNG